MHTPRRLISASIFCVVACVANVRGNIQETIERAIYSTPLKGAHVSVSVRDPQAVTEVVSFNSREPMIPASNMKLLTSGAALFALGPDFQFKTRMIQTDDRLVVIGSGDPAFGDPDLLPLMRIHGRDGIDVEQFISLWTDSIVEADIRHVREVVIDDRIFDRTFVHPSWPVDQLNRSYCAEVSGFNFHANVLHFYPRPRRGSHPDISDFRPLARWLDIDNKGTCQSAAKERNTAWLSRAFETNDLTFRGNVRFAYKAPVPVTVHDMPTFFAQLIGDRLAHSDVSVSQWRVANANDPKFTGTTIGPVIATPFTTILTRCNRDSENLYAECLIKRIAHSYTGRPGSWDDGAAAIRQIILERSDDPSLLAGLVISDGSGLSRNNRVTASLITAWLQTIRLDERMSEMFYESLALAGETGTLRKRFKDIELHGTTVRAKSGYIKQVSALSGYVSSPGGETRCFSILINDMKDLSVLQPAKRLQERIVSIIATDLATSNVSLGSD